jgi:hypothetical protein
MLDFSKKEKKKKKNLAMLVKLTFHETFFSPTLKIHGTEQYGSCII